MNYNLCIATNSFIEEIYMIKNDIKFTLNFILENIDSRLLLKISQKENVSTIPKKLNGTYKKFLIKKLLSTVNIKKTNQLLKQIKFTNKNKFNSDKAKNDQETVLQKVYDNFEKNDFASNRNIIEEYNKSIEKNHKIGSLNQQEDKKINDNTTIIKLNKRIKLLKKNIISKDKKIDELNKNIKDLKKSFKKIETNSKKISDQNGEYKTEISTLNEKVKMMYDEIAKQNSEAESNKEYYIKKVKQYKQELLQIHYKNSNFRNKNYHNDQSEMSELKSSSSSYDLGTSSEKRNLLIQAPKNIDDRRKLRTANIEVIESELFYDPEDNFGEKYETIEEIPQKIKLKLSDYDHIYLYKDKLPIGDLDKLKHMFNTNRVKEIDESDIEEIL